MGRKLKNRGVEKLGLHYYYKINSLNADSKIRQCKSFKELPRVLNLKIFFHQL